MATVVDEKFGCAEIEARKRRERLLRWKRKAQGQLDDDEEEQVNGEGNNNVVSSTENVSQNKRAVNEQMDELDLSNLAPRKVDWDLKRGIAKSLEILQERTNEIIAEIVRERLEENETD